LFKIQRLWEVLHECTIIALTQVLAWHHPRPHTPHIHTQDSQPSSTWAIVPPTARANPGGAPVPCSASAVVPVWVVMAVQLNCYSVGDRVNIKVKVNIMGTRSDSPVRCILTLTLALPQQLHEKHDIVEQERCWMGPCRGVGDLQRRWHEHAHFCGLSSRHQVWCRHWRSQRSDVQHSDCSPLGRGARRGRLSRLGVGH
jgi:hypothetical protein